MTDIDKTLGELKREAKLQKSLKKREKKDAKRYKKGQKKSKKKEKKAQKLARKAGMEYAPPPMQQQQQPVSGDGTTMNIDWGRRSTVSMDKVEQKLDNLFESRGMEIRERWMEKYGDEPDIPTEYLRPKVDMEGLDRTPTSSESTGEIECAPTEKKRFGKKAKKEAPVQIDTEKKSLGLLDLKAPTEGLWLYQNYGIGKNKIVSIIILIISLLLWISPMLVIRLIVLVLRTILGLIKKKKTTSEG